MNNKDLLKRIIAASKDTSYSCKEDFVACIEKALKYIEQCEQRTAIAETQLKEYSKDKEIQKLQEENKKLQRDLARGFAISEAEHDAIIEWMKNHKSAGGAIGGSYTYEFIPTSIGTIGTIKYADGAKFTFREL